MRAASISPRITGRPPGAPPYCGAARRAGSSYCAAHALLCSADPASRRGALIVIEQELAARAAPTPQHFAITVPPEFIEETRHCDASELPPHKSDSREEKEA